MKFNEWFERWGWVAVVVFLVVLAVVMLTLTVTVIASRNEEILQLRLEIRLKLSSEEAATVGPPTPPADQLMILSPIHPEDFSYFSSAFGERDDPLTPGAGGENVKDHGGVDMVPFDVVWNARVRPVAAGFVTVHWPPKGRPVPGHPGWTYNGDPERGAWIEILHHNG